MDIRSLFNRFRKLAQEMRAANGANVTITFALATIPMVGFVGAAVDYSRANSVKTAMQAASDATALMLSKVASGMTASDIQSKGTAYFTAIFNRPEANGLQVTSTYTTTNGSQIVVKATANVKTDFMGMIGQSMMKIGVDSQIKWGNTKLRVALVLDNTGSMADDGKMSALKTATNNLLDQLKTAAVSNGDVYVSIIPFVKDVNVGASNYNATWIYWGTSTQDPTLSDNSSWDAQNGSCSKGNKSNRSDCLSQNGNPKWTPDNHSTWNGCVVDRGAPSAPSTLNTDTNVAAPNTAVNDTLFAAEQYGSCPKAILPLTYDWTGMKSLVASMASNGNTNQGIGLQQGWMSLVGGGPYPAPPAEDPNYKYSKVIILLTDGLNTQNRWYTSQSKIDARQALTCTNIKAAGITLYTVQVNTGGDPTSTLLQQCASDSAKFFLLTSASQMVSTFQQIGTNLSNLRIAQ
ncbi:pilus assembly protein [Rhodoplanes sp. Z2-YC6860]|uniref:pilus assembly protein n=1 Tax=Rhodoplanes sp. Z2-YC6860 TaxID=674703 RepID=UPI00082E0EF7|nr:pilus assembly protein [Rhodoplanes sp. Z2-YC6860]